LGKRTAIAVCYLTKGSFPFAVADLEEGAGGPAPPPPPLFWVKKEEITEGRNVGRASKTPPPPPPHPRLAQGLDPPLFWWVIVTQLCTTCTLI